jgi:hypothetical protein
MALTFVSFSKINTHKATTNLEVQTESQSYEIRPPTACSKAISIAPRNHTPLPPLLRLPRTMHALAVFSAVLQA